jgi:hypothetical protein
MKVLYGLSWRLLHRCHCPKDRALHPEVARLAPGQHHITWPLFAERTAFRLPTMALFGILCALVYLLTLELSGSRWGALAAALLMAAQPRAFFHAKTASFDLPAAFFWLATSYAYWRALRRKWYNWPSLLTGILFGLFLATKLQSFFLPFALAVHWLIYGVLQRRAGKPWPTPGPLLWMALLGPMVLLLCWPWLWHDTFSRFADYLHFHWTHVHYNFEYLGTNYNTPPFPWHVPFVMLFTTAPVMLLTLAAAGIGSMFFHRLAVDAATGQPFPGGQGAPRCFLLLIGALPIALFAKTTVPIFGATKHWLATMPVLAICAGIAVSSLLERLYQELRIQHQLRQRLIAALVLWVGVAPSVVETARSHPFALSHYNALAGGAPGGADLGMNRQFWGYSVFPLLPAFNRWLPQGARLYLHDWNYDSYIMYIRDGLLRPDLVDAGMEIDGIRASDAALVIHERHFNKYDYMIWQTYGHLRPIKVLTLDGVPLVSVYRRSPEENWPTSAP